MVGAIRLTPIAPDRWLALLATFFISAATAVAEPIAVEVTNASEPVLCAEKDNVTLNLASKDVRRLPHRGSASRLHRHHAARQLRGGLDRLHRDWRSDAGKPAAAQAHHALRGDRLLGGGPDVPDLLAPGHRHRAHRRPRREGPAPSAGVDDPADGRRGGAGALSAGRLLAPAAAGAGRHGADRLRLVVPDRAGRGRGTADRADQGDRLRSRRRAPSRWPSSAAARRP